VKTIRTFNWAKLAVGLSIPHLQHPASRASISLCGIWTSYREQKLQHSMLVAKLYVTTIGNATFGVNLSIKFGEEMFKIFIWTTTANTCRPRPTPESLISWWCLCLAGLRYKIHQKISKFRTNVYAFSSNLYVTWSQRLDSNRLLVPDENMKLMKLMKIWYYPC